jgi:putative transposase
VTILREADETLVQEVAKKHGVSAQTIYGWRKHYGTLEPADVKRLRQIEHENGRLKKLVADLTLDPDARWPGRRPIRFGIVKPSALDCSGVIARLRGFA